MTVYLWSISCLVLLLVIQTLLHYKERRDLYNRLMSRDVYEYKKLTDDTDGYDEAQEDGGRVRKDNPIYNSIRRNYRRMYGED